MDPADFGPTTQQLHAAQAAEALPPGTNLGGFRVVEVLGRGSSSIVYLALDSSLQRQVAIKEYLPADLAERGEGLRVSLKRGADAARFAQGVSTFLQRAKLLARLDHPALPRVHGFWQEHQTAYMTMAYCEGHSLADVLAEMLDPPDEAWLRALMAPLLGALELLHAAQCTHGGISADNILVQADGSPVLLGLGAARRLADPSRPAGPGADLKALAEVLHLAIGGGELGATRDAVDHRPPSFVDTALELHARFPRLHYSAAFLACVDAALSNNPRRRINSVAEFRQRLDRVPTAQKKGSVPSGTAERPSPTESTAAMPSMAAQPQRGRQLWAVALGLAVLGVAGGWWRLQTHAAPPPMARVSESPPVATIEPVSAAVPASKAVQVLPVESPASAEVATIVATSSSQAEPVPDTKRTQAKAAPAEPNNPRAVCGQRTNFSLYYCMQTQCKRPQFLQHRQCLDLRENDAVN
ncbi:serine/threonine protein kinase [Piscinibacter terrae]|nr:protein kinase [Albitalea terrae]